MWGMWPPNMCHIWNNLLQNQSIRKPTICQQFLCTESKTEFSKLPGSCNQNFQNVPCGVPIHKSSARKEILNCQMNLFWSLSIIVVSYFQSLWAWRGRGVDGARTPATDPSQWLFYNETYYTVYVYFMHYSFSGVSSKKISANNLRGTSLGILHSNQIPVILTIRITCCGFSILELFFVSPWKTDEDHMFIHSAIFWHTRVARRWQPCWITVVIELTDLKSNYIEHKFVIETSRRITYL